MVTGATLPEPVVEGGVPAGMTHLGEPIRFQHRAFRPERAPSARSGSVTRTACYQELP